MLKITAIEGNSQRLDGGAMFGNAPRAVWEKWCQPDNRGRIKLACRAMLVEVEGLPLSKQKVNILCETGIGCFFEPKLAERFGVEEREHILLKNLSERAGLNEQDIDYVILSHLHFDHAGGLMRSYEDLQKGNTDLLFVNAQYLVSEVAFSRALKPHARDQASFILGMTEKLLASGRLKIIKSNADIPAELRGILNFIFTEGHTPGQMHAVFTDNYSNDKTPMVVFAGDLIPGLAWLHSPITMGYDRFPEKLIDEKLELYEKIKPSDYIFFTHDVDVAMARVELNNQHKMAAINVVTNEECFRVELTR